MSTTTKRMTNREKAEALEQALDQERRNALEEAALVALSYSSDRYDNAAHIADVLRERARRV